MARYDTTGLEVDGFRWISTLAFPCKAVGKALCSSSALEAQRLCEVVTSSRQAQMTFCQQFQHPFSACFRQNLFHFCLLQHKSAERSLPFGFTLEIFDILIFSVNSPPRSIFWGHPEFMGLHGWGNSLVVSRMLRRQLRRSTMSSFQQLSANSKGVAPSLVTTIFMAPKSNNKRTTSRCPFQAAKCRGVQPVSLLLFSLSAPTFSKCCTTSSPGEKEKGQEKNDHKTLKDMSTHVQEFPTGKETNKKAGQCQSHVTLVSNRIQLYVIVPQCS